MSLLSRIQTWLVRRRRGPLEVCEFEYAYRHLLKELWEPAEPPPTRSEVTGQPVQPESPTTEPRVLFSLRRPPPLDWKIAFTGAFSKAIAGADRSMQGRILLALAELSSDPATPRGDTVKPLIGEQQGLWRYRLGDYRLVYQPQIADRMVVLVDFAARGSIYD